MLPPFLGMLLFLGTALVVIVAIGAALVSFTRGNGPLARRFLVTGGVFAGVYCLFWVLGFMLAPTRVLSPGKEVSFCGLDCHLHVAVVGVSSASDLGVTVRFSSNAVRAPEFPSHLKFRLRDAGGQEYAPINTVPDSALRAGATWDHELRFPSGVRPAGAVLMVTWDRWLDLFVPGAGNPLVQRRQRLALPTTS